jgi:predicted Zn finger-like uncharacterized protein
MIVQCKQCRTKFRFDDALISGDGVWLRCSRCQHVFFQDNPLQTKLELGEQIITDKEQSAANSVSAGNQNASGFTREEPSRISGDEDIAKFVDDVMEIRIDSEAKLNIEEMERTDADIGNPQNEYLRDREATDESAEEGEVIAPPRKKKGLGRILRLALWIIIVAFVIPALIYFVVFPQMGDRLVKVADKIMGTQEPPRPEMVIGQVKLQDIRQRILNNYILGQIRVVEGTAVNQADYPISRIIIKGEIVDAYSVVLAERASYAGNVLSDDELITLPEEEILKRLAQPEGRNNANDKIMPNGQIPFMIVFAHEPAGVIKTTVVTVAAERLLQ